MLEPNQERPETAELAVSPTARAAAVYVLADGRRGLRAHDDVRARLRDSRETDLIAWLAGPDGKRLERDGVGTPDLDGAEAVIEAAGGSAVAEQGPSFASAPAPAIDDLRGGSWDLDGDRERARDHRARRAHHQRQPPRPARAAVVGAHRRARRATSWSRSPTAMRPSTGAAPPTSAAAATARFRPATRSCRC